MNQRLPWHFFFFRLWFFHFFHFWGMRNWARNWININWDLRLLDGQGQHVEGNEAKRKHCVAVCSHPQGSACFSHGWKVLRTVITLPVLTVSASGQGCLWWNRLAVSSGSGGGRNEDWKWRRFFCVCRWTSRWLAWSLGGAASAASGSRPAPQRGRGLSGSGRGRRSARSCGSDRPRHSCSDTPSSVHSCTYMFFLSPFVHIKSYLIDRAGLYWLNLVVVKSRLEKPFHVEGSFAHNSQISQTQSLGSCSVNVHNQFSSRWNYSSHVCI